MAAGQRFHIPGAAATHFLQGFVTKFTKGRLGKAPNFNIQASAFAKASARQAREAPRFNLQWQKRVARVENVIIALLRTWRPWRENIWHKKLCASAAFCGFN
jgi:hypothetical protein